jgi:hypothetical protein
MKEKQQAQVASLTQTRDRLVKAAHGAEEQSEQSAFGSRDRIGEGRTLG